VPWSLSISVSTAYTFKLRYEHFDSESSVWFDRDPWNNLHGSCGLDQARAMDECYNVTITIDRQR
jgi:hypothetical protein